MVSDCHSHLFFLDNRLAMSTVKIAMSLLFVRSRKTGAEYWEFDTSLFRRISASRMSNVLHKISMRDVTIIKRIV
ncbi:hypothetical protein HanHA300_Chr07g0235961 [Helianthus annuus]|nr:hypothetical protein HanHA300_Chr07g0235961 [Helianthus annuus]KAJ0562581.1 hypothetical protein HanHA89_Chr07g0253141 [Helianthus annuus]KAJ0727955.1 hypothetical protein HanLR1_Chr07g0235891 [Helianthus annuus]